MATEKQIAASRANGAKSRGPKTPEGKKRAAGNRTTHGVFAAAILHRGESRAHFADLARIFDDALRPRTPLEQLFVSKMVAAHWRVLRLLRLERAGESIPGDLEMRLERQFFRNYDRYIRLRDISGDSNPITPPPSTTSLPAGTGLEPDSNRRKPDSNRP